MFDVAVALGGFGIVTAILSLVYSRNQAVAAREQVRSARAQAEDALEAASLVANGAREQALEALRAAELVAAGARLQAVEALRAAELVAESARRQALEALRAAELLATSEVSERVREMRARNLRANPNLPADVLAIIADAGGPDAYSVLLDSLDISQEIYLLRKRGVVSDERWRMWMHDQMVLIAASPAFERALDRAVAQNVLSPEFVAAFGPVLRGERIADPAPARDPAHPGTARPDLARPRERVVLVPRAA